MDSCTWERFAIISLNIFYASGFEHFGSVVRHIYTHLFFIFFELYIKRNGWLSPFIFEVWVEFHEVVFVRQTFAEAHKSHVPSTRFSCLCFSFCTKTAFGHQSFPIVLTCTTLKTKSTHIITLVATYIAVTRHINTIRSTAILCFVIIAFH